MSNLSEFLLARIAEDEAAARAATHSAGAEHPGMGWNPATDGQPHSFAAIYGGPVDEAGYRTEEIFRFADEMDCEECVRPSVADMVHIARWDPARVLVECEAKRRIVHAELAQMLGSAASYVSPAVYERIKQRADSEVLRALALPYADHHDYDEAWRP